jgi:hypothetical protein
LFLAADVHERRESHDRRANATLGALAVLTDNQHPI